MTDIIRKEVLAAEKRIRKHIRETPLESSPYLSQEGNCQVHLKLENFQHSGSFKARGALSKYLSLTDSDKERGIMTASSGNHGAAVAYVLNKFSGKGTIYVPHSTPRSKVELLRLYGVDLELYGDFSVETEAYAQEMAEKNGRTYISPYNDFKVIGGQGTIGIELLKQMNEIDTVLVPIGGGGLISGIGGYLKSAGKRIEVIGCETENSPAMSASIKAGKIIEVPYIPTLADGTVGGMEQGSITFDLCKKIVDDFILVSEEEMGQAIRLIVEKHHLVVEGAAAMPVAAFLKKTERFKGKNVVLILTSSKINLETLKEIICPQKSQL
ncbi:MAG: threonine/serine dehydratase [Candidatus Aminicenantes bacterium]|nr:threonine/serine dehydratase [Candidatus Aminicenantes bacterium]